MSSLQQMKEHQSSVLVRKKCNFLESLVFVGILAQMLLSLVRLKKKF